MEPIIFDFNGTMFQDTVENIKAWTELIYRETGYTVSKEDFRQHINGVPDVDIIRYFLKIPGPMAKLEHYADEKEKIYRDCVCAGILWSLWQDCRNSWIIW
jgi:beta-phosphoglucomutase-like phosphatase (HAD superfamily)